MCTIHCVLMLSTVHVCVLFTIDVLARPSVPAAAAAAGGEAEWEELSRKCHPVA